MRRHKFLYKALFQSTALKPSTSLMLPYCGYSITRQGVSEKSTGSQEFNLKACQRRLAVFGKILHDRDIYARQHRRWNYWHLLASGGLLLGATTLPVLAQNEENSNERVDGNNGSDSIEEKTMDMEKILFQVQKGVGERLEALKLRASGIPTYNVSAKGQQISVRFTLSPSCDVPHLIVDMINRLGGKSAGQGGGSEMTVQALDSTMARQLIITAANYLVSGDAPNQLSHLEDRENRQANKLCILMFEPLTGDFNTIEVEFLKRDFLTSNELDTIISALCIAGGKDFGIDKKKSKKQESISGTYISSESLGGLDQQGESLDGLSQSSRWKHQSALGEDPKEQSSTGKKIFNRTGKMKVLEALETMGVKIYGVSPIVDGTDILKATWDTLAGYNEQKREIEDTILLALKRPDIYDTIAHGTRRKYESNRPHAILFEGPPGTGKTSCARVIANQAGIPLLYVPLEVVMSKYFGESERLLASIFHAGNELPNGAILFLDEIDALATMRDSEMHEATRRMLSVLLRQMDGFEQKNKVVIIAATNRKQDLDPALLSRFDSSILFSLPDLMTRQDIIAQYAQHLTVTELTSIASVSEGMSGRDLHDVCQQAERKWASKIIRGVVGGPTQYLPPIQQYLECTEKRRQTLLYRFQDQYNLDHSLKQNQDKAW